jgi:hypothetical protein
MKRIVVDTNLLVLLIVGPTDRALIKKHKRTLQFEVVDFDQLCSQLANFDGVLVSPNVLTEVSNLISQIGNPACNALRKKFAELISTFVEIYVPSDDVAQHRSFARLGLTDCGLLNLCADSVPMLTTDLDLYLAAIERNPNAVNFHHLRQTWLLGE